MSEAKKRALLLADNKIAENAGWDRERLAIELPELADLLIEESLDISITGFEPVEIDQLVIDFEENTADPADDIQTDWLSLAPVSQPGDVWQLGPHRLLCGDARQAANLDRLLGDEQAAMAFLDPPYNVKIGSVVGRGRTKHGEFAMASGEMSRQDYVGFLIETLGNAATHSRAGARPLCLHGLATPGRAARGRRNRPMARCSIWRCGSSRTPAKEASIAASMS